MQRLLPGLLQPTNTPVILPEPVGGQDTRGFSSFKGFSSFCAPTKLCSKPAFLILPPRRALRASLRQEPCGFKCSGFLGIKGTKGV